MSEPPASAPGLAPARSSGSGLNPGPATGLGLNPGSAAGLGAERSPRRRPPDREDRPEGGAVRRRRRGSFGHRITPSVAGLGRSSGRRCSAGRFGAPLSQYDRRPARAGINGQRSHWEVTRRRCSRSSMAGCCSRQSRQSEPGALRRRDRIADPRRRGRRSCSSRAGAWGRQRLCVRLGPMAGSDR